MLGLLASALVGSASLPPPPVRPAQFDLACTGMVEAPAFESTNAPSALTFLRVFKLQPWSGTFRVDLSRSAWCEGKCSEVHGLALAKPGMLVLIETNKRGVRQRTIFEAPDGTFLALQASGTAIEPTRAHCVVKSFMAFPTSARLTGQTLNLGAQPYTAE